MMNYPHHQVVEVEAINDDDNNNNNNGEKKPSSGVGGGVVMIEREHMFDKVVTPSDVGKLNRLVIPKQHAEKYFPLDSTTNEKGLLLNFEDGTGKPWRFRYSYWNSSQSYVMTKGWSRFVKEKKLDAGDIVSFQRGVGGGEFGKDKLFIDWRRRPEHHHHHTHPHGHAYLPPLHHHNQFYQHPSVVASHGRALTPHHHPTFVLRSHPYSQQPNSSYPYPQPQQQGLIRRPAGVGTGVGSGYYGYGNVVNPYPVSGSLIFVRSTSTTGMTTTTNMSATTQGEGEEDEETQNVYESVPVVQGKAAAKRLRLFGVNMECTPISHQIHQHTHHDFDILSSSLAPSSSSSSSSNNNYNLHHQQYNSTTTAISMGPPSSGNPIPLQLRSLFNGTSSEKGKSSTSSSSMSLDLDI